jgi:hypothetical protein
MTGWSACCVKTVVSLNSNDRAGGFIQPVIRISGPALEEVDTKNGYLNYTAETQDNLQITLSDMAGGNLYGSSKIYKQT